MTREDRFAVLKRILIGAIELPADRRAAYVAAECGEDDALRADVERKLARLGRDASILLTGGLDSLLHDTPDAPGAAAAFPSPPSSARGFASRYRVLEKIGEGGFGEVHLAEQTEPVRRRVALKILKAGLDTRAVLARFEAERQALALMDHPCIARVLDAGETPEGRPYFAMEYVDGLPITAHCDRNRLGMRARLELFLEACEGVQHAHQKAVIHRDVKPSNVLVGRLEDRDVVKVIDFGVAKAVAEPLTERTLHTEHGQLIGTPEYMSPEQAEMSGNIDTRTDVYSLGAMLYELMTGQRPFDSSELRIGGIDGVRRTIREKDPPRPSTRVSTAKGDEADRLATARRTTPKALAGRLRGDLDWITMKAMEKDRARRYDSPADLAADLRRHLRHEAVAARPPSVTYRTGRFVRRNRIGVAVAAATVVALVSVAVRERNQAARIAREQAGAERAAAFLGDMLGEAEPQVLGSALWTDLRARVEAAQGTRGSEEEARAALASFDALTAGVNPTDAALRLFDEEILGRAAETIEKRLGDDPLVAARLHATLGRTYGKLGLYENAETHLRRSLALRTGELPDDHPDVLATKVALGVALVDRSNLEEARELTLAGLEGRERVFGRNHVDTFVAHYQYGHVLNESGDPAGAEEHYRIALAGLRRLAGDDDPRTLDTINNLGFVLQDQERYEEAEALWRESLESRRRVLGDDDPMTLESLSNLGFLFQATGRLDEAEPLYREALDGMRRVLGENHPWTLTLNSNLGYLMKQQGRLDEAAPLYRTAVEGLRRVRGTDADDTLMAMNNLAFLLRAQGNIDEGVAMLRETVAGFDRIFGAEHPSTLSATLNLASFLCDQARPAEAATLCRGALDGFERTLGEDDAGTQRALAGLADALRDDGRFDESAAHFERLLALRIRVRGEEHRLTNVTRYWMALTRMMQRRQEDALTLLETAAENGYDITAAAEEPGFEPLRGQARFEAALAAARKRLAADASS
jgi:eukaryotic-like serine/threonine-protein kinase